MSIDSLSCFCLFKPRRALFCGERNARQPSEPRYGVEVQLRGSPEHMLPGMLKEMQPQNLLDFFESVIQN